MTYLLFLLLTFQVWAATFTPEVLVNQKDVIWGFDFMKDETVLFTERGGKLFSYNPKTKETKEITGTPKVYSVGQGGLLDIRVHPQNGYVYITYSKPTGGEKSATVLARFKLNGNSITEFKEIFEADSNENPYHYGSRIEFVDDKIFITSGERGDRPSVQKKDTFLGKIIRMNEDGTNPEIWSMGLRSPQGLALRPGSKELWEAEMGPQGGDELNIIKKGANYGWAVVTYGREYEGQKIGEGTEKKGMERPIVYWVPSISPSAMTFWKNDIWLANLSGEHLRQIKLKGQKVVSQEKHLDDLGWRFRNVRPGPDGSLWFSTDEGKLGRLK
jgi:aldose sugar dehydrogenase